MGGGFRVDHPKTDFHAYYTNDFRIFDVPAGVGRTQKPDWRLWGCLVLSHLMALLSDGIIWVTSDSTQDVQSPYRHPPPSHNASPALTRSSSVPPKIALPNKSTIALIFKWWYYIKRGDLIYQNVRTTPLLYVLHLNGIAGCQGHGGN